MTGIVTRSSARAAPPASTADAKLAGPLKKRAVVGATDPPEKSRHQDSCALPREDKSDEGMMREAGEVDGVPDCPTPPTGARATRSPYSPDPEHAQPQQLGAWWAPLVRAEATAQRGQEKNQPREKRLECERDVRPKRSPRGGKTFTTMTRPTEPPAAGLGVRVERPGQDRRLLPRRDLPNGPKALWTSHVRRSPPRRFDDTSRDRAPPNQRYAPRPRSPDNDSDSLSLAPSSDGSDDEYGPSTGLARRKHQSENEVASAAALAAAHAAQAALSDSEDEEVREDTAPTRAVEASPETVARFNARDRTVSPAPTAQIRARARTMSPPRYADTRRRGSSPPRFSNNRSRENERRLFGDPSPRRESSREYHDRGGWDRRYSPDTRGGRRRSPSPMRRRDEYRGGDRGGWDRGYRDRRDFDSGFGYGPSHGPVPHYPHRVDTHNHRMDTSYASPPRASPLPMLASTSAPPPVDPRKNTAVSSNAAVFAASQFPRPDDIFIPREPSSFAHAERAAMQNVMQDPMGFKSELCPFAPGRCPAGAMCEKAHGVEQLRDSVVPGVRVFDPSDPPLPHLYRACVHTALCTVSRCCVWVDQFAEVFKFANAAELALPVKFGNVPYSMEEYLRRFMSPHTVRVFECDGRAAVTLAMPDAPPEEERRETDWLDDRDRRDERTARTTRRGGDGRENERPRDDDWNFDANRRREREFDTRRDDDDDMRPRKKMKVVVAHKNGPRTHHPPADPSQSCWYMDTHGNNGLIIGTKGATIKDMQKQSGASIDANFMDHKVFITGRPDAVLKARRMIEHRLGEKGHKFLGAATLDDLNADLRYEQRQDRELWTEQRRSPELTPPPAVVEQEDSKDSVTEACTTPEDKNQSPLKEQQSPSRLKAKQRVSPNICTFFDAGNCRKGASCRFSHVIAAPKATPTHECKSCKLQFADLDALKRHKFSEAHLKAIRTAEGFDSPENKFNGDRVFCVVCKVYVQGLREQANFRQHVAGEKHKEKLALFGGIPAPKKFDHLKCKLCNHLSGSLADIQAHYKGAMHKERLALFGGDNVCQPIVPMESPAASPEPTVCASPDAPSPPPGGIRSNQLANRCDECKETFGSSEELRVHKTTTTHKTRIDEINKNFDEMRKKYMEVERPRAEAERVAKKKADKAKDSAWRDIQRQHAANWRGK